jgi:acetyltransferase-like isoleucine patch superfamily enzyme
MIYSLLNKCGKKIRGDSFNIDNKIPIMYLINFSATFVLAYFRGIVNFGYINKRIFVGKATTLLCKKKFIFKGSVVKIEKNCHIDALSSDGIVFGHNVSIQKNVSIECTGSINDMGAGLELGDNVGIGSNSFLGCAGGISIGEDTIVGNFVSFHSENHNFDSLNVPIRLQGITRKGIVVGKNCWIGAKVTILDGTVIGDGCVIAAGAVLTGRTYEKGTVIAGVPGKVLKKINHENT